MSILEAATNGIKSENERTYPPFHLYLPTHPFSALSQQELSYAMTPFDLKRLESYSNNMLDYHVVLDVLPTVASLYFQKRLVARSTDESNEGPGTSGEEKEGVHLSAVQSSILLGLGLQRKTVEDLEGELDVPVSQLLALFTKIVRKISKRLVGIQKEAIGRELPPTVQTSETRGIIEQDWKPVGQQMDEELDEAGKEVTSALRERQREMIDSLDLSKCVQLSRHCASLLTIHPRFAINNDSVDWATAESQVARGKSSLVSVKSAAPAPGKRKADEIAGVAEKADDGKKKTRRGKRGGGGGKK